MLIRSTLVAASLWALSSYSALANFSDLVEKTSSSVCLITFTKGETVVIDSEGSRSKDYKPNPFDEYLKPQQQESPQVGSGTCFIVSLEGKKFIATNEHVASDKDKKYKITFYGHIKHHSADLIANDKLSDLAVLELSETEGQRTLENMPAVEWGNSDKLRSGDDVYAIGHPLGMIWSVTKGIVSYNGRRLQNTWQPVIQSDVSINTGNSGGPLFNSKGKVVGVNSFIFAPGAASGQGGSIGVNFSISGNQAEYNLSHLIKYNKVRRSKMGLAYTVDKDKGVVKVSGTQEAGPARKAGLIKDDVLLKINDVYIITPEDLGKSIDRAIPGTKLNVVIERDGKIHVKELTTVEVD